MITRQDEDYLITREIKRGNQKMNADFDAFANWISEYYDLPVMNILHDHMEIYENRARLTIVFEFPSTENKFREKFNESHAFVGEKFDALVNVNGATRAYDSNNIWIVMTSFAPIAREEANSLIPQSEIDGLKAALNNPDLWTISRFFSATTYFFHTDEQLKRFENSDIKKVWTDNYFTVLKKYDEFGYFNREGFGLFFDSKENFDTNYASNWYYYYK